MTICLYGSPISTFARKVAIGLELKGLPYDLVDALTPDRREELRKLNPRLEVPVLTDGDLVVVNSSDILQYLELALSRATALSRGDRGARRRTRIRAAGRSTLRSNRGGLFLLALGGTRRRAAGRPAGGGPTGYR
jgi:glutathione S-transferase